MFLSFFFYRFIIILKYPLIFASSVFRSCRSTISRDVNTAFSFASLSNNDIRWIESCVYHPNQTWTPIINIDGSLWKCEYHKKKSRARRTEEKKEKKTATQGVRVTCAHLQPRFSFISQISNRSNNQFTKELTRERRMCNWLLITRKITLNTTRKQLRYLAGGGVYIKTEPNASSTLRHVISRWWSNLAVLLNVFEFSNFRIFVKKKGEG